jgi:hypothetical protein
MLYPSNALKSLIIELLASETLMNAKQIQHHLASYYSKKITIQGIYKTLNKLIQESIVIKHQGLFRLSLSFLQKHQLFSAKLLNNVTQIHQAQNLLNELNNKGEIVKYFNSELENYNYFKEFMLILMLQNQNQNNACHQFLIHYGMLFLPQGEELIDLLKLHSPGMKSWIPKNSYGSKKVVQKLQQKKEQTVATKQECLIKPCTEYVAFNSTVFEVNYNRNYKTYFNQQQKINKEHQISQGFTKFLQGNHPFKNPITLKIRNSETEANQLVAKMQALAE